MNAILEPRIQRPTPRWIEILTPSEFEQTPLQLVADVELVVELIAGGPIRARARDEDRQKSRDARLRRVEELAPEERRVDERILVELFVRDVDAHSCLDVDSERVASRRGRGA